MPQIGPLEVLLLAVIALIVFGPQKLPEIARSVGRAVTEFRRQLAQVRSEFTSEFDLTDVEDERAAPPAAGSKPAAEESGGTGQPDTPRPAEAVSTPQETPPDQPVA